MDVTGIDIGALAAALGAVVKSLHSDRKTAAIEADRIEKRKNIDERFAVLEQQMRFNTKRLDDGDNAFRKLDDKIDAMNGTLRELIGEIRAGRK